MKISLHLYTELFLSRKSIQSKMALTTRSSQLHRTYSQNLPWTAPTPLIDKGVAGWLDNVEADFLEWALEFLFSPLPFLSSSSMDLENLSCFLLPTVLDKKILNHKSARSSVSSIFMISGENPFSLSSLLIFYSHFFKSMLGIFDVIGNELWSSMDFTYWIFKLLE